MPGIQPRALHARQVADPVNNFPSSEMFFLKVVVSMARKQASKGEGVCMWSIYTLGNAGLKGQVGGDTCAHVPVIYQCTHDFFINRAINERPFLSLQVSKNTFINLESL